MELRCNCCHIHSKSCSREAHQSLSSMRRPSHDIRQVEAAFQGSASIVVEGEHADSEVQQLQLFHRQRDADHEDHEEDDGKA